METNITTEKEYVLTIDEIAKRFGITEKVILGSTSREFAHITLRVDK